MSKDITVAQSGMMIASPALLAIEASGSACSVALSVDTKVYATEDSVAHDHSAVLTLQIEAVVREAGLSMRGLQAVVVSVGPGSYTSLRIGLATAKGIAYAIGIPIIAVPTLEALAYTMVQCVGANASTVTLMPMIDARRMEVYTQPYDASLLPLWEPSAKVLDEAERPFFERYAPACFGGIGAEKAVEYLDPLGFSFIPDVRPSAQALLPLGLKRYEREDFASVAYQEPLYLKAFQSIPAKKSI